MNTCVIWARVSSREQREGYSLDAQVRINRERAAKEKWPIVREFVVAESAKRGADRAAFNEMYKWVRANARKLRIGYLLCHKLDRACRNMRDAVRLQDLEDSCGIKLAFVENQFGPGAAGALSFNVMAAVAQYYSDNLRTEVIKGIEERARQGWAPGVAPYGYINVPDDRERPIQPHPVNSKAVQRIFELYANTGSTFEEIASKLEREGFTYRGTEPRFSRTAISYILNNRFYIGFVRFRGQIYAGKQPVLVPPSTFETCQRFLKGKNRRTSSPNHYLAGGRFQCAHCGYSITGERIRRKMVSGTVHEYVYYRCGNVTPEADHPVVRWSQEKLEAAVAADLARMRIPDEEIRTSIRSVLAGMFGEQLRLRDERVKALRKRLHELEESQKRLLEGYLSGAIDQGAHAAKNAELAVAVEFHKEQLANADRFVSNVGQEALKAFDLAQKAAETWEVSNNEERCAILEVILLKRSLSAVSLVTTKKKPFDLLAEGLFSEESRSDRI